MIPSRLNHLMELKHVSPFHVQRSFNVKLKTDKNSVQKKSKLKRNPAKLFAHSQEIAKQKKSSTTSKRREKNVVRNVVSESGVRLRNFNELSSGSQEGKQAIDECSGRQLKTMI